MEGGGKVGEGFGEVFVPIVPVEEVFDGGIVVAQGDVVGIVDETLPIVEDAGYGMGRVDASAK